MTKKIKFIANLIPKKLHNLIIDVGCDHGYLGILLLQQNKVKHVLNIDNKTQPLQSAIKNTHKYGLEKQITNQLNEGLKNLKIPQSPDLIVMAGIGTKTIIKVLNDDQVSNSKTKFIFQSEGCLKELVDYLINHNFVINDLVTMYDHDNSFIFLIAKKK